MNRSNPNPGRMRETLRSASRALPAAALAGVLALTAVPALAIRPEPSDNALPAESNPFRTGIRHLRKLQTQDLFDQGEKAVSGRLALAGDAGAQILRRLNARLQAGGGEARIRSVQSDGKGNRHIRVDFLHRGYPVIGGDAVIHVNADNEIYAVGGSLAEGLATPASAKLKAADAGLAARQATGHPSGAVEKQAPRLVVFDGSLAYETLVAEAGPAPRLWQSFVDANTGEVLFRADRIVHSAPVGGAARNVTGSLLIGEGGGTATVNGWLDNLNLYFLRNNTALWGVYDLTRSDWAQNATGDWGTTDRAAVSLAKNFETTQGYVSQVLGRNSFDNAGAFATANAHEGTSYVNAYWDGSAFHFGDGDGIEAGPLTVLDVAAHEYGHAITQYTSNLTYSNESGALNESFSDILGASVEFWAQIDGRSAYPLGQDGRSDWLMGEDCWLSGEALRDLRNPGRFGQPSYYLGTNWSAGSGDNGGVHTNSGVQNFAFYLLSQGGTGTNDGHSYSITGLGYQAASAIAWYANMYLLTSGSQYRDAREGWVLAATTLGYNAQTVRDVWTACGVLELANNLSVSPASLAFGPSGVGAPASLNLTLSNSGANPTTVTGLSFSDAAFATASTLPLTVPGGASVNVSVRFQPAALGPVAGNLSIASNADDNPSIQVALSGTGVTPAGILITPGSFAVSLASGANVTQPLSIANTALGGDALDWTLQGISRTPAPLLPSDASTVDILSWVPYTDMAGEYANVVAAINSFADPHSFATTVTFDPAVLESSLADKDLFMMPERENGTIPAGTGAAFRPVLQAFLDRGGEIMVHLPSYSDSWNFLSEAGLIQISGGTNTTSGNCVITDPSHPLMAGVVAPLTMLNLTSAVTVTDNTTVLATYNGSMVVGVRTVGRGRVIVLGPDFFEYTPNWAHVLSNAVNLAPRAATNWLTASPLSGSVIGGDRGTALLRFDAANMLGGTYTADLLLAHNDPMSPNPLHIPVTLQVDGFRSLSLAPASLAFGNQWAGTQRTLQLTLTNGGSEATVVTSISTGHPEFTVTTALPLTIQPFQSASVNVRFAPVDVGAESATLSVTSNAEDNPSLTAAITGTGTLAPSASLTPNSLSLLLTPGQAPADRTATLINTGGDVLNWRIASILRAGSPQPPDPNLQAAALPAVRADLIYSEENYAHAYLPGRVIVGFKPGRTDFASAQAASSLGIQGMRELAKAIDPKTGLKANTGRQVVLVTLQEANGVRAAIDLLRQDANVAFAEPDYIETAVAIPNDPSFAQLYGMHNTGQAGGAIDADIDAPEAWDRHTGNRTILIGVIDTGIDYLHPDLAANIWTNPGEIAGNGIDDDHNGFIDDIHGWDFAYDDNNPTDGHYHGTHVSGTIAAVGNDGVGVAGVMWTASLVALKFLSDTGSGSLSDAVDAVNYANAMGIRITSNSWGGGGFSQALMDAIAAGGLFVAAAGNDGVDNDLSPHYPSSYALDNVIAVAATDNRDALASFSCFGRTSVDLGAPGVNTYSTSPGGGYRTLSGTSMATPHVSGVAGLVWTSNPGLSPAQVKAAILSSTDPDPALNGRTVTGGRLNARKALDATGPNWLRATPNLPAALAPGSSAPVTVTIDPAGMVAGHWEGIVNIATDDPAHAMLPLGVSADITGCRTLSVAPLSFDFGSRAVGSVSRTDLTLSNACNDTVTVSSASSDNPAFALVATLPFQVLPFQTLTVPAEFRPTAAGAVSGSLSLASNADADPVKTVALLGQGVVPPFATVTPAAVSRTLSPGATAVVDLDIGNTGGSDLLWTLAIVSRGFSPQATYDASHFAVQQKGAPDNRVGLPVTESSGGPDAFGYRWTDSDQPDGPVYQWQDISATGTLVLSGCDDCSGNRPLSFAFPFYGNRFSQVNFTTNGWASFDNQSAQFSNFPLPSTSMPSNLVAGFFDDLTTSTGGVYFQDFGDRAIIQYQNVALFSGGGNVTFQIVLHSDGEIDLYYENMTGSLLSATTGIQNATGAVGLQVQYNTAYIKNHLAVRFRAMPDWLRVSALSGTVPAGGSQRLALTLDAGSIAPGTYAQTMTLTSNNPAQTPISIPVNLTVTGIVGISRVLRVGPSALPAAAGSRYYLWNMTVGGETRGLVQGSRYKLYLK